MGKVCSICGQKDCVDMIQNYGMHRNPKPGEKWEVPFADKLQNKNTIQFYFGDDMDNFKTEFYDLIEKYEKKIPIHIILGIMSNIETDIYYENRCWEKDEDIPITPPSQSKSESIRRRKAPAGWK